MVGKLIKHELISTLRIALIPAIVMVLLAILARIMSETSSGVLTLVIILFYVFAVIATLIIGYFFGVYSFYQSLFTGTGYLTLSLPVTPDQLIWSKLLSAIIVMFSSIIICILSACIFLIGASADVFAILERIFSALGEMINYIVDVEPLIVTEFIIYSIISVPMMFLVFYAIMSIGQLFTVKNRKGMAVALYIGLIFVWNILNTTIFRQLTVMMLEVSIHLYMWVQIAFTAAVNVGCYFLVRYIIKNKVNLLA